MCTSAHPHKGLKTLIEGIRDYTNYKAGELSRVGHTRYGPVQKYIFGTGGHP